MTQETQGLGLTFPAKLLICQWEVTRLVSRLPFTGGQRDMGWETRGPPEAPRSSPCPCADGQESCSGGTLPLGPGLPCQDLTALPARRVFPSY